MKIQKIQTFEARNNDANKANPRTQPVFRGGTDGLIAFWDAIGRGGWTANFILQDVLGNNVPRTTISLNRNKEELGHLNYIAGAETFIRESLSGPSMVAIPLGVMALSTRLAGPATRVPMQNIADFAEIIKGTARNIGEGAEISKDAFRQAFYTDLLNSVGKHSLNGSTEFTAEALERIAKIESGTLHKRTFIKKLLNKDRTGSLDEAFSNLQKRFSKFRQQKVAYGENFFGAKMAAKGKETDIADLISQAKEFFDDFTKKGLAATDNSKIKLPTGIDAIADKFKNLRSGQRFVTGIAMTGLMMLFLSIIPKIYSISKTSPELSKNSSEAKAQGAGGAK